eukprot:SM000011S19145  [mRNA]  locus=s11:1125925:1133214:+ [translate_table: standard]
MVRVRGPCPPSWAEPVNNHVLALLFNAELNRLPGRSWTAVQDPKDRKWRRQPFFLADSGTTSLSASGILLNLSQNPSQGSEKMGLSRLVLTSASALNPFLRQPGSLPALNNSEAAGGQLILGVEIHILLKVDLPRAAKALRTLISSQNNMWAMGWSLTPRPHSSQNSPPEEGWASASGLERGSFVAIAGSPFGVLSSSHFLNSVAAGIVSNKIQHESSRALLIADIRALPGMEGGPVVNLEGRVIGLITEPIHHVDSSAEVQLIIPSDVIMEGLSTLSMALQGEKTPSYPAFTMKQLVSTQGSRGGVQDQAAHSCDACELGTCGKKQSMADLDTRNSLRQRGHVHCKELSASPAQHSIPSDSEAAQNASRAVVMIATKDGAWASGVILSQSGIVVTNAHLLEPWRFRSKSRLSASQLAGKSAPVEAHAQEAYQSLQCLSQPPNTSVCSGHTSYQKTVQPHANSREGPLEAQDVQVHIDFPKEASGWYNARIVHVSQGPIDVGVLQIVHPPVGLAPIAAELAPPRPGSLAFVIGYGLFAPLAGLRPSVTAGVIAQVVCAKTQVPGRSALLPIYQMREDECPAMLRTTAMVQPGCSGGAVVDARGHMIGLVTSNARHAGGIVLPHLNFSYPIAVIALIFHFADTGAQDTSLLQLLDNPDQELSSIWAMATRPPALLPPLARRPQCSSHPSDDNGKGAALAKFLSDRELGDLLAHKLDRQTSTLTRQSPTQKALLIRQLTVVGTTGLGITLGALLLSLLLQLKMPLESTRQEHGDEEAEEVEGPKHQVGKRQRTPKEWEPHIGAHWTWQASRKSGGVAAFTALCSPLTGGAGLSVAGGKKSRERMMM